MQDRSAATRIVAFWLAIGVLGGVLFLWRMREVDPDRAVRWRSEAEMATRGRAMLRTYGFTPPADTAEVLLVRETTLLDSLQRRMGRPALIEALQGPEGSRLPAYVWIVRWKSVSDGSLLSLTTHPVSHEVQLDGQGRLLGLRVATVHPESLRTDARALQSVRVRPRTAPVPLTLPPGHPPVDQDSLGGPTLTDEAAGALARYHLKQTPLVALAFVVDSVQASTRPGLQAARVLLHSTAPDVPPRYAEVEVAATGALLGLAVRDTPTTVPESLFGFEDLLDSIRATVTFLLLVVLGIAFVRRLARRQIDMQGSIRDASVAALLGGVWIFLGGTHSILAQAPTTGWAIFIIALNVVLIGAACGFTGMAASGVATSLAQLHWPEKVHGLALLRRGALHDGRVGRAMLRGTCAALAALGVVTLTLQVLPYAPLHSTDGAEVFLHEVALSALGLSFTGPLLFGYLAVMALLVPAAALGERSMSRKVLYLGGAVLLLGLLDGRFSDLVLWLRVPLSVAVAGLALYLVLRYDALTALVALFVVSLLWSSREG
ncbi:MAG TPA: hypothetical protein VD948_11865, partial [Rhodothermales bacterium]|nr:hypothetical protein [Rhodothermales bacterium]